MNNRTVCLIMIILVGFLSGCKREDPNPELSDRIYQDMTKELSALEGIKEETEKKIIAAEKELAKTLPRTLERKNAENDLAKLQYKLVRVSEMTEYYKIHTERRRVEGRRAYKLAFQKGEAWPDPKEYEAYLVNKRLVHASRNWSDRVPKPASAQTQHETLVGEEIKGGGGEEGAGAGEKKH